jgi:CheY-like chemotaxis protein
MRILVADDNQDSARTLARVLELRGDQVFCTFDGPSTIEFVTQNEPDAVLLDIGLPGMDGYQVAEKLRTRWSSDRLKLIAVTGYGGDADLNRGRTSGFDHYLIKPLDLDTLDKALAPRQSTG